MSLLALALSAAHPMTEAASHVLSAGNQGGQGGALNGIDSNAVPIPGGQQIAQRLVGVFKWGGLVAAVLSLISFGITLFWSRNHGRGGEDHTGRALWILLGVTIISSAVSILSFFIGQ